MKVTAEGGAVLADSRCCLMLASASESLGADKNKRVNPMISVKNEVVATSVINNQISTSQKTFSDPYWPALFPPSCQIVHHINNNNNDNNNDNSNGSNDNTEINHDGWFSNQ